MIRRVTLLSRHFTLSADKAALLERNVSALSGALAMALCLCGVATAQCSQDLNGVVYGVGCSSGGGSQGGSTQRAPVDPAAQERYREYLEQRRQERLRVAAAQTNNKGVEEFKKGNYAKALAAFRSANLSWPKDLYMDNIKAAAERLGIQIDVMAENKLAPVNSGATSRIAETERKAQAALATGHESTPRGNSFFGVAGSPDKPPLAEGSLPYRLVDSAIGQASSMANSGGNAVGRPSTSGSPNDPTSTDPEVIKAISNCGVDTLSCAPPDRLEYARPVQSFAAAELANHMPDAAKNDRTIQQRLMEYDQFSLHQQSAEKKIADVDLKIKAGGPDAEVLKAYQADLINQAEQDKKQKKDTQDAIQNQMQNLGLDWVEQAPKPATKP
jgi:hypothetical protein